LGFYRIWSPEEYGLIIKTLFVPKYIDIDWNGDLKERMLMIKALLAVGANIEVWANRAFVADSNDRNDFAAITFY